MNPTVLDVAHVAGVSVGTVSRTLSGHPTVSPENRERVLQAVSSLGYKPQRRRARELTHPFRGMSIGIVFLGLDRSLVHLPVVAEAVHGAEAAITAAGGAVMLVDVPDIASLPRVIERNLLHGVILKGALQGRAIADSQSPLLERLRTLPRVWLLGRPRGIENDDVVRPDDFDIGRQAAAFLADRGHKVIAFLNPKPDHVLMEARQAGFEWEAKQRGITAMVFLGNGAAQWTLPLRAVEDVECVRQLVDQVLAASPRPTAIFTPADSIAALVYRVLQAHNVSIGQEMSVISCNAEQPLIGGLYPELTTFDVHAGWLGRRAVELLAWRLRHPEGPPQEICVQSRLVVGASVAFLSEGAAKQY